MLANLKIPGMVAGIITDKEIGIIFGNIQYLYTFHMELYSALKAVRLISRYSLRLLLVVEGQRYRVHPFRKDCDDIGVFSIPCSKLNFCMCLISGMSYCYNLVW